jgi:hypothetical protein
MADKILGKQNIRIHILTSKLPGAKLNFAGATGNLLSRELLRQAL